MEKVPLVLGSKVVEGIGSLVGTLFFKWQMSNLREVSCLWVWREIVESGWRAETVGHWTFAMRKLAIRNVVMNVAMSIRLTM